MFKKVFSGILVLGMALLLGSATSFAKKIDYEGGAVSNGGSISGSVSFAGDVPPAKEINLLKEKNSEFCTTHPDAKDGMRTDQKVLVKDGKLQNAIVFIEKIEKGKEWPMNKVNFDFQKCDIVQKMAVIRKVPKKEKKGEWVTITNQDPDILHNPHGYSIAGANRKTLFNKPLPSKGDVANVTKNLIRFKEKKDDHFFLQCDQHNFMEADARIVWNPYNAITGADGSFKLDQVPAGKYKVVAWHPYVGEVTKDVTVSAGADAKADFELKKK